MEESAGRGIRVTQSPVMAYDPQAAITRQLSRVTAAFLCPGQGQPPRQGRNFYPPKLSITAQIGQLARIHSRPIRLYCAITIWGRFGFDDGNEP